MIWTMPFNSETSLRIMADCERTRITIARVKAIFDHFWRQQGHWPLLQWPAWEQGQSPPASIGCIPMKCPEEGASGDPVLAGNPVTDPMVAGVCLSAPSAAIEPPDSELLRRTGLWNWWASARLGTWLFWGHLFIWEDSWWLLRPFTYGQGLGACA